ncbi:hypothetical protein HDU84_004160 [Entophlyctis sp. JEL0112]|nr:hypothetical protein HDU84_004160 [Entophlyctis sp. JEL0112]
MPPAQVEGENPSDILTLSQLLTTMTTYFLFWPHLQSFLLTHWVGFRVSGTLLKLNATSDAVTNQWKSRFFVFTDQGHLYLFRSNKNLNAAPVTYLPVNRCTTFDDTHDNSRILRVDGSGLDPASGVVVRRTWTLKTADSGAFDMWHRTIVRHLADKISSGGGGGAPGASALLRSNSNTSSNGGRDGSAKGRYVGAAASGGGTYGGGLRQRSADNLSEARRRAAAETITYRAAVIPSTTRSSSSNRSVGTTIGSADSNPARLQGLRQRSAENLADAIRRENAVADMSAMLAEWEGIASFGVSGFAGQRGRQMQDMRAARSDENLVNARAPPNVPAESNDQRVGRGRVTKNEVLIGARSTSLVRSRNPSPAASGGGGNGGGARGPADRARRLTLLEAELQDLAAEFQSSM